MERKWLMRAYEIGDEEGIFELWNSVYPAKKYDYDKWLRWWQWLHRDNPAGKSKIWLAEHNGKIVGQYAIMPIKVKIDNEVVLFSQSLDTMTHPNYRRQAIFETLAKRVYDEAHRDGISIVYGFPNKFSHPGFINKLSWFDIGMMQLLFKPLNWRKTIMMKTKNPYLQIILTKGANFIFSNAFFRRQNLSEIEGLSINQISFFDERFDEFWTEARNQSNIILVRNKKFLSWRYGGPDASYSIFAAEKSGRICGYLILKDSEYGDMKVSHIVDLFAQSDEIKNHLLFEAEENCRQNNVDLILYYLLANRSYYQALRKNGFFSLPFLKGGNFCAYSSSLKFPLEFLSNSENWLVQMGDSDAV
jgi:hypothetical protein